MKDNKQYIEAKKFLNALSLENPSEVFHFQTFDDLKDSKRSSLARGLVGTLEQHFEELIQLNIKGAGVFVTVGKTEGPKRDANSIVKIRAVFADKDDGNFDSFPIEPSILVQSKNGQHAYWITNEISITDFKSAQKRIINTLKTDISIHDLPRVMRLPGFYHRKDPNNPFFVKVLKNDRFEYTAEQIYKAFPQIEPTKIEANVIRGSHSEVSKYVDKLDGAIQGENGDLKTFQVACDLVRGFNLSVDEAIIYFRRFNEKCVPMWTESELKIKLQSAQKSGSGDFGYLLKNLTTEQWVHRFIQKNNVRSSYNQKISFNGETISSSALVRKAEIQWDNEGKKSKIGIIKSIFEEWECESRKEILNRMRRYFKYDQKRSFPIGEDPISCFTRALVGENCEKFDQHRAVLAHFVWQVKRKLFGYEVNAHLCPVLVGKQGSGKTQAIENLIRPLKSLSLDGNLAMFVKDAERFAFGTYYIIKLDEFAKGTKSDLDTMKTIMTSTDVNFRTFYTQKMAVMPNVSTYIAASNKSVAEVFNDQTGNRRFYEIPCLDKLDWKEIGGLTEEDGIDYTSLWRSIDEEMPSPITPFIQEINKYQEGFRAKTIVEEWLESENLVPHSSDQVEIISLKTLHRDFMSWMKDQNCHFMYTNQRLGRELSKYLEQRKRNSGSHYVVKIKSDQIIAPMTNLSLLSENSQERTVEDQVKKMLSDAMAAQITLDRDHKK